MGETGRGSVIPGFFISNCGLAKSHSIIFDDMFQEQCEAGNWSVGRRTFKRFLADKTLYVDEQCCIVLEGVILNKGELFQRFGAGSVESLIKKMVADLGETFFSEFRGSFSGAYYDLESSVWTVWTNHYGNNAVFYHISNGNVCVGSNFWDVLDMAKSHTKVSLDERAVISLLTYGGMSADQTYVKEVRRLLPGHYLRIASNGDFSVRKYWHFSHDAFDLGEASKAEIISELDARFRRAVDRQFSKDTEYGYRHLAELSGGLDSRMISWVAHELDYTDIVNITFGQTGCLDESIAGKLSTDLGNQFMFMPMDDAGFLLDLDKTIQLNFGLTIYSGTTGLRRFLANLDMDSFGLIHSGTLGDVVIGSYLKTPADLKPLRIGGLYSPILEKEASSITDLSHFVDQEEYLISTRGFLTIATSDLIRRGFSDVASPFLDVDFFDYCMSVPLKYRCGHRLYKDWILSCYPEAARYVWEKNGVPLSAGRVETWVSGKRNAIKKLGFQGSVIEILRRLGLRSTGAISLRGGMNPFDLWFSAHPDIKESLDDIYLEEVESFPACRANIKDKIRVVYEQGSALEATLALTVLHATRKVLGA